MSLVLGNLATTIVAEVPLLLERALIQSSENLGLQQRCSELKLCIDTVKQSIQDERSKQHQLRIRLLRLRGPPPSKSGSICELRNALQQRNADNNNQNNSVDLSMELGSFLSDGSPVSLRSKRKGVVFSDDFRISKRVRLDRAS